MTVHAQTGITKAVRKNLEHSKKSTRKSCTFISSINAVIKWVIWMAKITLMMHTIASGQYHDVTHIHG